MKLKLTGNILFVVSAITKEQYDSIKELGISVGAEDEEGNQKFKVNFKQSNEESIAEGKLNSFSAEFNQVMDGKLAMGLALPVQPDGNYDSVIKKEYGKALIKLSQYETAIANDITKVSEQMETILKDIREEE